MVGAEGERYAKKSEASAQVPRYVEYTTRNSNRGLWIVVQTFLVREKAEQKIRHILFRREITQGTVLFGDNDRRPIESIDPTFFDHLVSVSICKIVISLGTIASRTLSLSHE